MRDIIGINKKYKKKKAQVWVESVIYTLIGLAVIGLVLAVAKPKIDEMKDKLIIEQTIESMNEINSKIYDVQKAPGNKRIMDLKISRGEFVIDGINNEIYWKIDSHYQFSEEEVDIKLGSLKVRTEADGDEWDVILTLLYNIDLNYGDENSRKILEPASQPYSLNIENMGSDGGNLVVDISGAGAAVVSGVACNKGTEQNCLDTDDICTADEGIAICENGLFGPCVVDSANEGGSCGDYMSCQAGVCAPWPPGAYSTCNDCFGAGQGYHWCSGASSETYNNKCFNLDSAQDTCVEQYSGNWIATSDGCPVVGELITASTYNGECTGCLNGGYWYCDGGTNSLADTCADPQDYFDDDEDFYDFRSHCTSPGNALGNAGDIDDECP